MRSLTIEEKRLLKVPQPILVGMYSELSKQFCKVSGIDEKLYWECLMEELKNVKE